MNSTEICSLTLLRTKHQPYRTSVHGLTWVSQIILTASAGLVDDDLGFIPQVLAVSVVESLEDDIIRKNIRLILLVVDPTDAFLDAMGHEHQKCAV